MSSLIRSFPASWAQTPGGSGALSLHVGFWRLKSQGRQALGCCPEPALWTAKAEGDTGSWFIPQGPAEGEGGVGRERRKRGEEQSVVWKKRKKPRFPNNPGSSQPPRSGSVSYVTELAGPGRDGREDLEENSSIPCGHSPMSAFRSHENESSENRTKPNTLRKGPLSPLGGGGWGGRH